MDSLKDLIVEVGLNSTIGSPGMNLNSKNTVNNDNLFDSMYHSLIILLLAVSAPPPLEWSVPFPSSNSAVRQNQANEVVIIPFKRSSNLIIIEATIDGMFGNFILDTGAPGLILNKTYFRDNWTSSDYQATNAIGTISTSYRTLINEFWINELHFNKLDAQLSELNHIENQRGIKILGLLGVELFTSYEMRIDWRKGLMYLINPGTTQMKSKAPLHKLPFELSNNSILVEAVVNEKKLNFCFDTGAEVSVLSNAVPRKVLESFSVSKRMTMLGTGGAQREVLVGTITEIAFGELQIKNLGAIIARLDGLGEAYGKSLDGMIGYNLLTRGIISINFANKELCIYPFDDTDQ